jgi:hypothetical protein
MEQNKKKASAEGGAVTKKEAKVRWNVN